MDKNGDSEFRSSISKVVWNMKLCIVVIQFNCALLSNTRSEEKRVYGGREHDGVSLEQCDPPTTFTSFIPASGATAATWEPTKGVNETLSR